jgi:pimeloyl-ACP methyl ester carboxylesterase
VLPHDDIGSGEAVLLLHAGVADRTMWSDHLPWLADQGFRAIAPDLPGFGESEVAPGPQAPWEDVLRTMRELDVDRAILVGNSFGAAVALRAAVLAPAAVSRMLLISPPPLTFDEPSAQLMAAWEAEEAALGRGDLDAAVAAVVEAWLRPDSPKALRDRLASMQRRAFELQSSATGAEDAPDPLDEHPQGLEKLLSPVLTAAGEFDMPDFQRSARDLADLLPQARATLIAGAGHLAPLETPELFRELMLELVQPDRQP